jgi:uncharacterized RDD family membrane protein YckC
LIPEDKLTIETPELIPLEYRLAGIGSRFLAQAIDSLVLLAIYLLLGLVGTAFLYAWRSQLAGTGTWVVAILMLTVFVVGQGYYVGFEARWSGQTPGKRKIRLRVITDSGRPISLYEALARNMLRVVDSLPGFYALGLVTMLLSRRNKRLGDLVAGTVVVHERPLQEAAPEWGDGATALPARYAAFPLTAAETDLVEAFLARRGQLAPAVRLRVADEICARLARGREIGPEERRAPEALLEAYAHQARGS